MLALQGLKVIELGDGVAIGYCGALLRACGAEVVKIETPGTGDMVRALPPFSPNAPFPESSGLYAFLSAGKLSCTIDVQKERGARLVRDLASSADVMLEALGTGEADRIGLDHSSLKQPNPELVYTSLSWFLSLIHI